MLVELAVRIKRNPNWALSTTNGSCALSNPGVATVNVLSSRFTVYRAPLIAVANKETFRESRSTRKLTPETSGIVIGSDWKEAGAEPATAESKAARETTEMRRAF